VEVYEERFVPRYNCAPGQLLPVISSAEPEVLSLYRWGLVPYWAKDVSIGNKLINARAETLEEKPSFKNPFKRQRCLIPANGFYEWRKKDKMPFRIFLKDRDLFSMAGIWDVWQDVVKRSFYTFSIITVPAPEILKGIHHRMPAILPEQHEKAWLQESDSRLLKSFLKPAADDLLDFYPVSRAVNNAGNDREELIYPLGCW
jgi:putative SOS response-associated peptidase YedK